MKIKLSELKKIIKEEVRQTQEDPMWGRYNPDIASEAARMEEALEKLERMIVKVSYDKAEKGHLGHQQDMKEIERARQSLRQIIYNNSPRVRQDPWHP